MAGTTRKAAPARKVLTATNPTGAAEPPLELSDIFGTVDPQPPQPITLFGEPYAVRRDLTGAEVLEFARHLRQQPKNLPVENEGDKPLVDDADWSRLMGERLAMLLASGDPVVLWHDIGEQNIGVADQMVKRIYEIAGLLDAEGNFRAL